MNNPYYDENQAWMHPVHTAQDVHLQQLQTHWYEQQEADRQHQFYMQSTQNDFANLQAAAQQFAPHRHHHNGPGLGTMAAVGTLAYLAARSQQQRPAPQRRVQPVQQHPEGWKPDVLWKYLAVAAVLHVVTGVFPMSVAVWIFLVGSLIWGPAVIFGLEHQARIRAHNASLN